jgi:hypothetical protein
MFIGYLAPTLGAGFMNLFTLIPPFDSFLRMGVNKFMNH